MSDWLTHGAATAVSVSLLIVLVLLARRPVARRFGAQAAYALWGLPALRAVMPPLPGHELNLWAGLLRTEGGASLAALPAPAELPAFVPAEPVAAAWRTMPEPGFASVPVQVQPGLSLPTPEQLAMGLFAVWLLGVVCVLVRDVLRQRAFARLVAVETRPAPAALQQRVDALAAEFNLRRPVSVRLGLLASGPMIAGLVRPVVILPEWFGEDYSDAEQHHALVHELMHVRRGDLWALQGFSLIRALHWYNPLLWLALPALRTDQEAACDADVLARPGSSARTYGETLVKTARRTHAQSAAQWPAAAALPLAHPIKERLTLMQNPSPVRAVRYAGVALIALSGAALLSATASPPVPQSPELAGVPTPPADAPEAPAGTTRRVERSVIRLGPGPGDMGEGQERRIAIFTSDAAGAEGNMVLLSDPFAELHEAMQARGEPPVPPGPPEAGMAPMPPMPPMPRVFAFRRDMDLPGLKTERIEEEGGTRIIVPQQEIFIPKGEDAFDWLSLAQGEDMEGFEAAMEAWEEAHEGEMEAFEGRMEVFETQMEVWSDGMDDLDAQFEAAGEAVETLAKSCEGQPAGTIVSANLSSDGKTVRAACVGGLAEGTNLRDYVLGLPGLTEAERDHVRSHPPGRARVIVKKG